MIKILTLAPRVQVPEGKYSKELYQKTKIQNPQAELHDSEVSSHNQIQEASNNLQIPKVIVTKDIVSKLIG